MNRSAAGLNRIGLTIVGLLLLAGGGAALARALGVWGQGAAREPLLTDGLRTLPDTYGWFWYAVAVGAVLVTLLALAWLLAQSRSEKLGGLSLDDRSGGSTKVSAAALTSAVEEDVAAHPGVEKARARLLGSRRHPRLVMTVAYGVRADPAELRGEVVPAAVARLRNALDRETLPTVVRLRLVDAPEHRTPV
ncbi:alkaline shock response membrane anchor protein AmaP [Thermomonospora cellulosilytica]|uniref:Alkaline shock response membrane anchor protein AmaP n=1 Tax=Thermomonospora cellulosilytica TaxID=1411118 RepID=A0A7W3N533_9ACTN|nr:alkaline shock response membrane anchor protein AmaP [Thermomonospora cellulosilytica]MBA9007627.1 hypothetical protein [Thermomonospora cellulosilytica]